MTKPTIGSGVEIDVPRLLETRLLVQANSGGGKSWALRRLLEQTASQVQQIVLDSEGEFASLREKFDYLICAPHDGDAVAHPSTAALLARRLLETGVSAVVDIYDLKAHQRQEFVRLFLEAMVNAPKKLWNPVMVVLDEAHVFAPERGKSTSTGAVIDIATRGRKRGQCLIAATQRLSKLHKDVAAEMLNKMIGRTGLDVDVKRAADELGITAKDAMQILRVLAPGSFNVFGPAMSERVRCVKVGDVQTTHPKAGQRLMTAPPAPSAKIRKVLAELADLPKDAEQEAQTLADFKTENTRLKRELTVAKKQAQQAGVPEAEVQRRERAVAAEARRQALADVPPVGIDPALRAAIEKISGIASKALGGQPVAAPARRQRQESQPARAAANVEGLRSGAVRILQELAARFPAGYSKPQVGALTRFSHKGGTFNTYLSDLRRSGFLEERDGLLYASQAGVESLGDQLPQAPTTHAEAMALWGNALRAGAFRMLEAVVGAGPTGIDRASIAVHVGMVASGGTFNTYLSDLRRNGLITERNGLVVANDILFPEGSA